MESNKMKKNGDKATIDIKRLGINGEGIGYLKGQVVFVDGALPNEQVIVEAYDVKEKYAKAKIIKVLKKSEDRVKPHCNIYNKCGGCTLLHFDYQAQLEAKREIVKEAFEKYLGKKNKFPNIRPVLGMKNPWNYRNKVQIPLEKRGKKVIAGLYQSGSNRIIEMNECSIHHPDLDKVVHGIKEIVEELNIPIYDSKRRFGQIRNIVARVSFATKEIQVIIVTYKQELSKSKELIEEITLKYPQVISIAQNINPTKTPLIMGDRTIILWGQDRLIEAFGEIKYALSSKAFFQLNPIQMEVLYNEVKKAAKLTGKERVLDAYCGAGTIGLWIAKDALEVRGIEALADAIEDAKYNAKLNNLRNTQFTVGNVENVLPKWVKKGYKADIVIADPPRTGCGEELLRAIIDLKPKKIIYVSCNPATLAKDCSVLIDKEYKIDYVQPVDMFPQTSHVESVVRLSHI